MYVYLYVCMCAECICVHVCSRCMEARWGLWKSSLSFSALSLWFSSWTWSLWFSGRLTTSRLQWSSSLCLSSGGVIGTWDHVGLVTWVLGLELWSWKLRSRLLTVEPPNIFFFSWTNSCPWQCKIQFTCQGGERFKGYHVENSRNSI